MDNQNKFRLLCKLVPYGDETTLFRVFTNCSDIEEKQIDAWLRGNTPLSEHGIGFYTGIMITLNQF